MSDSMEGEQRQDKLAWQPAVLGSADKSEVAVPRFKTMASKRRCAEWARRPGASPTMRMTASWLRSAHGSTEYKAVARLLRPDRELPLGSGRADLQAARLLMSVKGEPPQ